MALPQEINKILLKHGLEPDQYGYCTCGAVEVSKIVTAMDEYATAEATRAHAREKVLVEALNAIMKLPIPATPQEYKTAFEYITKSIAAPALASYAGEKEGDNGLH